MRNSIRIVWLGQAGLFFEVEGVKILVDPYLSNSVQKVNSRNYRRFPVMAEWLELVPDVIVLTHNHLDHTDPETLVHYLKDDRQILVLASGNAWQEARKFGGAHNYVCFNRHTQWTVQSEDGKEIRFSAVYAEHSDDQAIGVVIDDGERKYYITGDTLYGGLQPCGSHGYPGMYAC